MKKRAEKYSKEWRAKISSRIVRALNRAYRYSFETKGDMDKCMQRVMDRAYKLGWMRSDKVDVV